MKIYNEERLRFFIREMLSDLRDDEVLIYFVFARKKYCPEIRNHHQMVFRKLLQSNDEDYVVEKLRSIPEQFVNYDTGEPFGKDCLSVYIDLSPKSVLKAWNKFTKKMADMIYQCFKSPKELEILRKVNKFLMSAIHKSNSRRPYILLDVDSKKDDCIEQIADFFEGTDVEWVSETHSGYHFILDKTSELCKKTYKKFRGKAPLIEIKSQVMTPIPGMKQGGFVVC